MICLPSTQTLQVVLGSGETAQYTSTWAVKSTGAVAQSNGTLGSTDTNVVTAPASGDYHLVKQLTIYNDDTTSITATIKLDASGTETILCKMSIPIGSTLFYSPESGFQFSNKIKQTLSYDQITSNVSITSDNPASPTTVITGSSFTLDADAALDITFFTPSWDINSTIVGRYGYLYLFDGDTNLAVFGFFRPGSVDYAQSDIPITVCRRITATSGSHTYKIKAVSNASVSSTIIAGAGTGGSDVYVPAFLRVERAV